MVKVPFALSTQGSVAFPQKADRASKWTCPTCDAQVIVKRGSILTPHFAHKATAVTCAGGESIAHRATKEWIASIVAAPEFKITARCNACGETFNAFRGSVGLVGRTEVKFGAFRVDSVAVRANGSVAAAFEVCHTHATGQDKMKPLLAATMCNAFEIKAIPDLVEAGYPTVFESMRPVKCSICLKGALAKRRANAEYSRALRVRSIGRTWRMATEKIIKERQRKFTQRWLFLARVSTVARRVKKLHTSDEESRFRLCATCNKPVELFKWVKAAEAPWGYTQQHQVYQHDGDVQSFKRVYHKDCEVPWCTACLEVKVPGKWCACERSNRRKCEDCEQWKHHENMHSFINPPKSKFPRSWVCDACAVECRLCDDKISMKQAKYGGACFTCNRRAKRRRMGHMGESDYYCSCGARKAPEFNLCYDCAHEP